MQARIEAALSEVFDPQHLEVINESHLHAGHQPSFNGEGETHFRIRIVSQKFENTKLLDRHRQINDVIKDEFEQGLHALAIEAKTPDQYVKL
jgi:BolA protein